ncbi:MAG: diguanylate cyclase [Deltaproteobacteria bacterium]|nr:diguanylate cyclase [Deltaproteobacteria bacterium]MBW2018737.1 diguanylate cyclase [Deltaproteobacteria bacterium]MBW2073466.1 diguanylate cyclase [Deltaproteobacteria bacterium]RLB83028.1 MAG: diguanylate cyclase response regulator [Deltaproteobacteria bacterium]
MTQNKKRILIVDGDPSNAQEIERLLKAGGDQFIVYTAASSLHAIDTIYSEPPDLVMINPSLEANGGNDLCSRIKSDTVFGHLPIIFLLDAAGLDADINWEKTPVDDYLRKPLDPKEVQNRISLAFARATRVGDANPLTRLPGNHSIMKKIQGRIDRGLPFAVAYVDLDHFKSYNDKYGFLRGDEILKMTARLLTNAIRKLDSPEAFVGHVGGDDFVFIVSPDQLDGVCTEVIKNFDLIKGNFYDEEDRIRGYIDATNRKGEKERFPIISLSIAVVTNEYRPIKHIGEVSAIAAELKKRVKSMGGSKYLKDLRGSKDRSCRDQKLNN